MQTERSADRLVSGTRLPSVVLPATDGTDVDISCLPGRTLLIVYPWTGRPGVANPPDWDIIPGAHGSTPELEGFRDHYAEFEQHGLRLFGLSRQTTEHQRELVQRLKLPFPILSDADGRFAAALRLPTFTTGGESYLKRLTLLIEGGRIETVFGAIPDPAAHAGTVLRKLEV